MDVHALAAELRALAERVEALPGVDRRDPHAFTERKSELAADLVALAEVVTARRDPPPVPMPLPVLPRRRGPLVTLFQRAIPV